MNALGPLPLSCPLCRAANEHGPACRRCKADLSLLFTIEKQRADCISSAKSAIAQGRLDEAFQQMQRASDLRRGPDLAPLKATLALLGRDFATALTEYHKANISTDE